MKSNMRKAAFFLLTVLACTFLLTGCHGVREKKAFEPPEELDEGRQLEISFWAKNDTNKVQTAILEKTIADFESLYPNITVNMRLYTDYRIIYNDVITNIATDTTPNVCITYPDHIKTYMSGSNTVVQLDSLFADAKYGFGGSELKYDAPTQSEMIPQFLNDCLIDGSYYAIPFMRSTEACYVNKDFVEKLGYTLPDVLTWDFIWEVSEAAMEKDEEGLFKLNGQKVLIPFIYKSTDNMMIQMARQKGIGFSEEDGTILLFNDETKELLKTIASHAATGAFSTFKISSYPANFLNAGQCVFAVDSTAGATWMGSNAPLIDISADKLVDFETAVLPVPQFDPSNMHMISQGPSLCIFNKADPQEVLASWLFAQYLLTNEVQISYSQTEGYVPVTLKAQQDPGYLDYLSRCGEDNQTYYEVKIKAAKLLMNHVGETFVTPVFNGSASLRDAAGQLIEEAVKGARRKKEVNDEFLDNLYADTIALYRLNQTEVSADSGRGNLAPMPSASIALLCGLAGTWVCIGIYVFAGVITRKKR